MEYSNKLQENADKMRQYYEDQIIKTRSNTAAEFQAKVRYIVDQNHKAFRRHLAQYWSSFDMICGNEGSRLITAN